MRILKLLLVLVILITPLAMFYGHLLGAILDPVLEKAMSDAFDMPVNVKGVYALFWPGHLHVDTIECLNPEGFRRRDHFIGKGVDVDLDLRFFKNKFVHIRKAHVRELVFAIESYLKPDGSSRTNVWHWYHHMGLDADDAPASAPATPAPPQPPPAPDNAGGKGWRVKIDRLELDKGEVVFDDRRAEPEVQWIFQNLKGHWTGFDYVSDYTSPVFNEVIKLEGTFGKNPPAHFIGEGKCQFADGDNFDVETKITNGSVLEYNFLLAGLPGEVRGGSFDLKSKMKCIESNLDSDHQLRLKNLKFASPTVSQKLMKYPLDTVLLLLEDQKTVELDMRVDGYIGDPKFRFFAAFTQALQKGLLEKAKMTLQGVGKGTLKLATETPKRVTDELAKLAGIFTDPFTAEMTRIIEENGGASNG